MLGHKVAKPTTLFALLKISSHIKGILRDEVVSLTFPSGGYSNGETPEIIQAFPKLERLVLMDYSKMGTSLSEEILINILQACPKLKTLQIEPFSFKTCTVFSNASNLEELQLAQSNITDFSALKNVRQLKQLELSRCWNLENLSTLSCLEKLNILTVSYCQHLKTASPIEKCTQLEWIYLFHNDNLEYVESLAKCPQLKEVYLLGCRKIPLSTVQTLQKTHLKITT